MLLDRLDHLLRRHVDAQVDDAKARAFQHHPHQILADVVDIALDGQDQVGADGLGALGRQQRAQDLQAGLHRLGADQHLGHEILAALEQRAHFCQSRDQRLVQNFRRLQMGV